MVRTRRTFLASISATVAIAGCQDGGGPTPEQSPGGGVDEPEEDPGEEPATPVPGEGEEGAEAVDGDDEDDEAKGGQSDGAQAAVGVAEHPEYGEILVDGDGMTLYVFMEDSREPTESNCTGGCLENWPPLTIGNGEQPQVGEDVAAEVTTFERGDGDVQVAADGWPLYYFADDQEPGDATGQGLNDLWWILDPAGDLVRDADGDDA